jgi:hypothetical protein
VFLVAPGVWFALGWLPHHELQFRSLSIRLDEGDAKRLSVIAFAVLLADLAAGLIQLANNGAWTPGDYRASQEFVALIAAIILVAALVSAGALVSLLRRHRRKD